MRVWRRVVGRSTPILLSGNQHVLRQPDALEASGVPCVDFVRQRRFRRDRQQQHCVAVEALHLPAVFYINRPWRCIRSNKMP